MIANMNVMITEFSLQVEEGTAFYLRVRFHCAATKTHRRQSQCQTLMTCSGSAVEADCYSYSSDPLGG